MLTRQKVVASILVGAVFFASSAIAEQTLAPELQAEPISSVDIGLQNLRHTMLDAPTNALMY